VNLQLSTLALAYGADLLLGDPPWFPHPVRGMGLAIEWGERLLRKAVRWERLAGMLLVAALVGFSYAATGWLLHQAATFSFLLALAVSAVLLFTCLSTKDLALESLQVVRALETGDLPLARRRVSRIVGRDTEGLDAPEIVRATIETIAESTMDGILSPLFYFVVGGVPLAIAYKAINTLDSMIGHRSARYLRFGWAAAKLDTLANWIPARLSAFLFSAAAWLCGDDVWQGWVCAWRDGNAGPVPNAGIPESAMAGALGVQLGGTNRYQGRVVQVPPMGNPQRPLSPSRIYEAVRLMYACSLISWLFAMGILCLRMLW